MLLSISQSAISQYASEYFWYRYEELVYKSILTVVIGYILYAIYHLQNTNTKLRQMYNYEKSLADFKLTLDREIQTLNTKIQNNTDDLNRSFSKINSDIKKSGVSRVKTLTSKFLEEMIALKSDLISLKTEIIVSSADEKKNADDKIKTLTSKFLEEMIALKSDLISLKTEIIVSSADEKKNADDKIKTLTSKFSEEMIALKSGLISLKTEIISSSVDEKKNADDKIREILKQNEIKHLQSHHLPPLEDLIMFNIKELCGYLTLITTDEDWENLFVFLSNNYPDFKKYCDSKLNIQKRTCIWEWLKNWSCESAFGLEIPIFNYVLYKMNYEIKYTTNISLTTRSYATSLLLGASSIFYCSKRISDKIYNFYEIEDYIKCHKDEYPHIFPSNYIKCMDNSGYTDKNYVLVYKVC